MTRNHLKERTDYITNETTWLFQRFNYFLIGTAFLVTALATLVSCHQFVTNCSVAWFARLVCATGYALSVFFAFANHNASLHVLALRLTLNENPTFSLFEWTTRPWLDSLKTRHLHKDIFALIRTSCRQRYEGEQQVAVHTYLIAVGFALFWLIVSIILLSSLNVEYWWLYLLAILYAIFTPLLMSRGYRGLYAEATS